MRKLLNPFSMLVCGLVIGTAARLMDIYCENLGEIFSQMSVWILLGTLIAIYSPTKKAAALNILPFCLGMLLTYYAVAIISHGVYGRSFIIGWTVFALCTPVLAWFAWMAKQPGALGKLISVGIVLASVVLNFLMFGDPDIFNILINLVLIYFLFFKKIRRKRMKKAPFWVLFSLLFCILMSSLSAGWCSALAFSHQGFLSIV